MPSGNTAGKLPRAGPVAEVNAIPRTRSNPIDTLRARYRWLDRALTINERVGAVGGGYLASAIALAAFLSLFPLLVVGIAIVGFFSADDADFAARTVDELGLEGDTADPVLDAIHAAERNRRATTVVGLAGLAWSGLAVMGAVEAAANAAWQVKGRGWRGKPLAAIWLLGVGVLLVGSTTLAHFLAALPGPVAAASVPVTLAVDILLVLALFRILTNVRVGWRSHLPGAVAGGVGLAVLKLISGIYLPRLVESSSLYGSIGVVFALLAWFLLVARLIVYAAAINVVTYERSHGTTTAEIQVPRVDGQVALETTRGGAVTDPVTGS